jgi:hypothetical protein
MVPNNDQHLRGDGRIFGYTEVGQRTVRALELEDKILVFAVGNLAGRTRRKATVQHVTPSTFWKVHHEQFL